MRLREPAEDGLNWSDELILRCSGRDIGDCAPSARRAITDAAAQFNLRVEDGRIADLQFRWRGKTVRCIVSGVAAVTNRPIGGRRARVENSRWMLRVEGESETATPFESTLEDTDAPALRARFKEWLNARQLQR